MVKCWPISRRKGMYSSLSSHSALSSITASVGPSPKLRNCSNIGLIEAVLEAITSSLISLRASSRPEERRVGKECVQTCSTRGSRYHQKKTQLHTPAHAQVNK